MLTARKKQGQSLTLFLGARAGGLFGNADFYSLVKDFSLLNFNNLSALEKFQECYKVLNSKRTDKNNRFDSNSIYQILTKSLSSQYYREEDEPLADLVKAGFFDVILTTNIDSFLEATDAFWDGNGSDTSQVFVHGIQDSIKTLREAGGNTHIIKIFGDLKLLRYNTAGHEFDLEADKEFKNYLTTQLTRDVLIVGYDPVWDQPIEKAFPTTGGALWYVNEDSPPPETYLAQVLEQRKGRYLEGMQGSYRCFWQSLYDFIGDDMRKEAYRLPLPTRGAKVEEPGALGIFSSPSESPDSIQKGVFISYSLADKPYLDGLINYLRTNLRAENIYESHEKSEKIPKEKIKQILKKAKIAILLVSADFLASSFIRKHELPMLLDAAQSGRVKLLPVILGPCAWNYTKLSHYQLVNSSSEPLMGMAPYEQEIVCTKLVQQVHNLLSSQ